MKKILNFLHRNDSNKKKIPGMFYILVSFIPWIIYWVLCGMENLMGIIIPLVISLLFIIPQIRKQNFNLMDLTSVLYFSIAAVGTFIFNLTIFLKNSGFLGYFVLFFMGLFSLIIKKPYTLQFSKRDYPEIYWEDKSFLTINKIITWIWTFIFIANATIFLLFNMPFEIIFSNILIVFGIIFSIFFPLKAPAYFVLRKFKKFDWNIKITPQNSKKENEYDVIIVGSGIGGLTCGVLLSKRGYKVLVLEQHYQVGGYCSSFKRKDFVFNTGVENVSGLWEEGSINYLINELELKKEELFIKNKMRYIFKGVEIDANNLEEFIKVLSDMFPYEKENVRIFFNEAKNAYKECHKSTEKYGVPLPAELIIKVFGEKKLLDYPRECPHFYNWLNKTYKQKLDEYFKNKDLKTFFCALLGYIGTKLDETSAISALTAIIPYYFYGGYFPKGGAQKFANSLREVIENHEGKVLVRHKVGKILIRKGKVEGVKVNDKIFKSLIVVADANAKTTFLELVGEENLNKRFVKYIKNLKMSPSCFMVSLGIDMDLANYPTIIENLDEKYSIVVNSNADPNLAPQGKASITILTGANYYDFPERGTKEYLQKKKEVSEMLIQKVEKIIPNLNKHIVIQDIATPKTFERYTSMPQGAIYSFDQSIEIKRPYFKTPIKGLYLTGASTFPGGGIEAVVISGIICAHDICNWNIKTS